MREGVVSSAGATKRARLVEPLNRTRPGDSSPGASRHFLWIGGPFGPFTRELGHALRDAGARCTRVVFNGGDLYDWGLKHAQFYFGSGNGWSTWLSALIAREQISDLIIYGEAHPYGHESMCVAQKLGVAIHFMEQGYFRPFWITLCHTDLAGGTALPKTAKDYRVAALSAPEPKEVWLPPLTPPAAWKLFRYHLILWLSAPFFPRFRLTYEYSLPRQAWGHARRYIRQRLFRNLQDKSSAHVLNGAGPLFIVVLQRPGDSQLRRHSAFLKLADFIEHVVRSFANHAPQNARLLFKAHPLDHGIESHGTAVRTAARLHGVSDRVSFADFGDLHAMLPGASGIVCINSTAGLASIALGLPTIALGEAIYDLEGLTHKGDLDDFWRAPSAPHAGAYEAFRRVLVARTQIAGAYATPEGIALIVPEAARRLLAFRVDAVQRLSATAAE